MTLCLLGFCSSLALLVSHLTLQCTVAKLFRDVIYRMLDKNTPLHVACQSKTPLRKNHHHDTFSPYLIHVVCHVSTLLCNCIHQVVSDCLCHVSSHSPSHQHRCHTPLCRTGIPPIHDAGLI